MKLTKRIAALLLAVLLLAAVSGCGDGGSSSGTAQPSGTQQTQGQSGSSGFSFSFDQGEALKATADELTVTSEKTGVTVDLSPILFDCEDDEHTVNVTSAGTQTIDGGACRITSYDFDLDGMHELDTWIDIHIPYDASFCDPGEDPAQCVGAKYYNDAAGEWEDVLFDVDAEAAEVVIHTDHMSRYGCFEVKNAGTRVAYISNVIVGEDFVNSLVGLDQSASALADYASSGASSRECYKVGELALKDIFSEVIQKSATQGSDFVNNVGSALQLSDMFYFTEKYAMANESFWKKMTNVGLAIGAINLGAEILKSDKTDEDILTIYKDAGMYALSAAGETALGTALVGATLLDKSIQEFGTAARGYTAERINNVYMYYNEKYHSESYTARTTKDWRDVVASCVRRADGDQEYFKRLLEADIDEYSRKFFSLGEDEKYLIQGEFAEHFSGGRLGVLSKAEEEKLIENYKQRMYQRLSGAILKEMQTNYLRKIQTKLQDALNAVKDELNTKVTVTVTEDMEGKEKAAFGLYYMRFMPLSDMAMANEGYWTGLLDEKGCLTTTQTVIGYIMAGMPNRVDLFEKEEDIDKGKVAYSQEYKFTSPATNIVLKAELFPTLEEIAGFYENGAVTITDIYVPPELQAMMEASAESEDGEEEGCDIDLNQLIGYTAEAPFTILQDGKDTAFFVLQNVNENAEALSNQVLTYDQKTGLLTMETFTMDDDGSMVTISLSFKCVYSDDSHTSVILTGTMTETYETDYPGLILTIAIGGEKLLKDDGA